MTHVSQSTATVEGSVRELGTRLRFDDESWRGGDYAFSNYQSLLSAWSLFCDCVLNM
jgi:hypothetical protein